MAGYIYNRVPYGNIDIDGNIQRSLLQDSRFWEENALLHHKVDKTFKAALDPARKPNVTLPMVNIDRRLIGTLNSVHDAPDLSFLWNDKLLSSANLMPFISFQRQDKLYTSAHELPDLSFQRNNKLLNYIMQKLVEGTKQELNTHAISEALDQIEVDNIDLSLFSHTLYSLCKEEKISIKHLIYFFQLLKMKVQLI